MFTHDVTGIRVRYYDTDQMGIVYYGNYARFYEIGRVEALRHLGMEYKALEESGIGMPVYDMSCRFIRPAKYDDLLTIRVTIPQLPNTRIVFRYEIFNQDGQLLNTGETTLIFLRSATGRPGPAPADLLDAAKPFFD
ncbi:MULTISPECIES: acyl-CoA thioesterase [Spirosoma]|uniref:Acyl-CoA thioesterase n=1 Tax=Spirosoma liriopis TaxID=2937440 RepID=A0ABT0HPU4_9BACT|nr:MULTISPECIES: thioesterase family protein [Spirosoma]MCK8494020.1 acyl-CoA thioesterase [Spirosoma liriopis]UHG89037.1 acyl-CoA thioesterase [Spirosoma oryzicola]